MEYYEDSEYSSYLREEESKKTHLLTLGLPLGSSLVFLAVLNTIFTLQSLSSFTELVVLTGTFAAKNHLIHLVLVVILCSLTVYLWAAVLFSGRGCHLSLWVAGSVLLLLLELVLSSWTLILVLSSKDSLYWRKLWALGVDIGLEIYVISVAVVAANVMWRREDLLRVRRRHGGLLDLGEQSPLPPVGLRCRDFLSFYGRNLHLGTRVLVTADVAYSTYMLLSEEIPKLFLQETFFDSDHYYFTLSSSLSNFSVTSSVLVKAEDVALRLARVAVGILAIMFIRQKHLPVNKLGIPSLVLQMVLVAISGLVYLFLFVHVDDLSVSDRFYQTHFTFDLLFRLCIIAVFIKAFEKRRLEQEIGGDRNHTACGNDAEDRDSGFIGMGGTSCGEDI